MRKSNYINCQCKYRSKGSAESAISYLSECYYNQAENVKNNMDVVSSFN